jgi:hypothetical protein
VPHVALRAKLAVAGVRRPQVIYNTKTGEVVDIDMSKDFGAMAGGWPGGEKGVMMYAQSVRAPQAYTSASQQSTPHSSTDIAAWPLSMWKAALLLCRSLAGCGGGSTQKVLKSREGL